MSIHRLASLAQETLGRTPGDWFGPAAAAHLVKEAVETSYHALLEDICVYVAQDCTVYKEDVVDLCQKKSGEVKNRRRRRNQRPDEDFSIVEHPTEYTGSLITTEAANGSARLTSSTLDGVPYLDDSAIDARDFQMLSDGTEHYSLNHPISIDGSQWITEGLAGSPASGGAISRQASVEAKAKPPADSRSWTPVLLLIPMRLGFDKLNPCYVDSLKAIRASENCMGVLGGRPRHALYFLGFQEDNLIHLDPHLSQETVDTGREDFPTDSYHCKNPRKMSVSNMDPSCCLGVYCQSRESFEGWCRLTKELMTHTTEVTSYPMFGIEEGRAEDKTKGGGQISFLEQEMSRSQDSTDEAGGGVSEDFVFL